MKFPTQLNRIICRWALLGIALCGPLAAQAQFTYTSDGSAITITGYTGSGGNVTIPNTINGLPVTRIGASAFYGSGLTRVVIADSVTTIGVGAFPYCIGLTAITVDAFNPSYSSVDGLLFNQSRTLLIQYPGGKAGSYQVPNSVTIIGDYALSYCDNLTRAYFQGNAPGTGPDTFSSTPATVYYLPGTLGWGAAFAGRPTAWWQLSYPLILSSAPGPGVRTNAFGFTLSWAAHASVVVEASPDLLHPQWTPVGTNLLVNGTAYFSDPAWSSQSNRFYRLRGP